MPTAPISVLPHPRAALPPHQLPRPSLMIMTSSLYCIANPLTRPATPRLSLTNTFDFPPMYRFPVHCFPLLNLSAEEFIIYSICDTHSAAVIFTHKGKSDPDPRTPPPQHWDWVSQFQGEILQAWMPRPEIYVVYYEFSFNVVLILFYLIFLNVYCNIYVSYYSTPVFKY